MHECSQSSKLWRLNAEMMLSVVSGKELGWAEPLTAWGARRLCKSSLCKTHAERGFHLAPFAVKVKILLEFLLVSETWY